VIFSKFDRLAQHHGVEKIKTIGDAYMVVAGLPMPRPDHARAIAEMALDMQVAIAQFNAENDEAFRLRIGINSGPVVAGVIGIKKFSYDLWGDTVNTASRMESHGIAGRIQVTDATYKLLRDRYLFEQRYPFQVKGKGEMTTYLLTGRKLEDWRWSDRGVWESLERRSSNHVLPLEKIVEHKKDLIPVELDVKSWLTTATLANQPYLAPDESAIPKLFSDYPHCWSDDLREDVLTCAEISAQHNLEMLVLDQTRPE
jgi:hypothetical protein